MNLNIVSGPREMTEQEMEEYGDQILPGVTMTTKDAKGKHVWVALGPDSISHEDDDSLIAYVKRSGVWKQLFRTGKQASNEERTVADPELNRALNAVNEAVRPYLKQIAANSKNRRNAVPVQ
jgi:hypothetical protein